MRAWLPIGAAALLAACSGPAPVVEGQEIHPGADGRVTVVVSLRNAGGGEGEVSLTVTLRDPRTGEVVARAERGVTLEPREHVRVSLDLRPAAGADWVAEARARYPPR